MRMEVTVDTSTLQVIQFFIRVESTSSSLVFGFSGLVQVEVICGSEKVSVTGDSLSIFLLPEIQTDSRDLSTHFTSSSSLCDIIGYQVFSNSEMSSQLVSPSISLDLSTAILSIDQSASQNTDVYIKALTQTTFGSLSVNIVVCGQETIVPTVLSSYYHTLIPEETFTLLSIESFFVAQFSSLDSHQDCVEVTYSISSGPSCSESNSKF